MDRALRLSWQIVYYLSDVPVAGDWHSFDFLGESVIVIRAGDGVERAFNNVCRHRGSGLVDGVRGCARTLVCPYLDWTYALDGRPTGLPSRHDPMTLDMAKSRRNKLRPLGESEVCLLGFDRKVRDLIPETRLHRPPLPGLRRVLQTHKTL